MVLLLWFFGAEATRSVRLLLLCRVLYYDVYNLDASDNNRDGNKQVYLNGDRSL